MLKILFTYPEALPHETGLVNNLMEEDWDFLHVRKPDYSKEEMINFLELIPDYHYKVVLHSHYELIREFDLAGINLNRKGMSGLTTADELTSACDVRELTLIDREVKVYGKKPDLVTYSAHGFSEIQNLNFDTDYVFLSPIFDSISKVGYASAFSDAEILSAFLKGTKVKVIALGGIDNTKIPICKSLGFDGYAMLGDIWRKYFTFVETIQ
ncbi:thiamine phosphate synthase [Crocinitomix catalasitica]|uniref:thiamine phosphate synthase n=1 Tax=Crocinitomix catalasitica TaxID=184607 RepID=UPI000A05A749|nr:thiamine phosphate synthase [Crocinitomix catalasitica]